MNNKFITFEGIDGCGKSTQLRLLYESMEQAGLDVIRTREPGGTEGATAIRKLLLVGDYEWEGITECLLHFAARHDHVSALVKPRLERGDYVLCDRFVDSTIAYQCYGHGVERNVVDQLQAMTVSDVMPMLTFIFDLDVSVALSRAEERLSGQAQAEDRYEKMDKTFHERVRQGFLEIAEAYSRRCLLINADDSIASIHAKVIDAFNARFGTELSPVEGV